VRPAGFLFHKPTKEFFMRVLTLPEIENAEDDITRIMAFHDRLLHSRLLTVCPLKDHSQILAFDNRVTLNPMFDDQGTEGLTSWSLNDHEGKSFPQLELRDLIGCPVTGIGYLQDPDHKPREQVPYIQFLNKVFVCCITSQGGGVIRHDRPREDA
jgi:hypothetical protein